MNLYLNISPFPFPHGVTCLCTDNPSVIVINYSIYLQHNCAPTTLLTALGTVGVGGEITQVFTRQPVGSCVLSTCRITNEFLCKLQSPCSWQHGSTLNFFAASSPFTFYYCCCCDNTGHENCARSGGHKSLSSSCRLFSRSWATCLPC